MSILTIRYSKPLPIALVVIGALNLLLMLVTPQVIQAVAGVILMVLGVLMLVNPSVSITATEVQVRNPLGMVLKRYPITSLADLSTDGDVLSTRADGRKIVSLGFMVRQADVAALRQKISEDAQR
ncbi:hypothetical protein [Microbacterium sp. MPKO10]|uniref:hypothetical protein n=1 Tax=Microbacterium sp. MPKO10 TaxID=2989818 RepID=UPI00223579DA|nr:hypothetical protein [Microbacterium sp. MPKO10]MCW4456717.1 hypothetical protein [Microbacterium sp. MPKO10]